MWWATALFLLTAHLSHFICDTSHLHGLVSSHVAGCSFLSWSHAGVCSVATREAVLYEHQRQNHSPLLHILTANTRQHFTIFIGALSQQHMTKEFLTTLIMVIIQKNHTKLPFITTVIIHTSIHFSEVTNKLYCIVWIVHTLEGREKSSLWIEVCH